MLLQYQKLLINRKLTETIDVPAGWFTFRCGILSKKDFYVKHGNEYERLSVPKHFIINQLKKPTVI